MLRVCRGKRRSFTKARVLCALRAVRSAADNVRILHGRFAVRERYPCRAVMYTPDTMVTVLTSTPSPTTYSHIE